MECFTLRRNVLAAIAVAAVSLVYGCSQGPQAGSKTDEAQLKASFERRGPLNLNDVPPEMRDRVRGFMPHNGAPAAAVGQNTAKHGKG